MSEPREGSPLRVLVVDDEDPGRQRLLDLLAGDGDVTVVGACASGGEAIARIRDTHPDLVLLDVQMPEIDGFGVIEAIGADLMPPVIFVTAHDQYAIRAFEVRALDYLMKPFDRARFLAALSAAKAEIRAGRGHRFRSALGGLMVERAERGGPRLDRLMVPDGEGETLLVRTAEIRWIEAAGNHVVLHMDVGGRRPGEGDSHAVRCTLLELEGRLDPQAFLRVHRETLVNVEFVSKLHHWSKGQYRIVLDDGTTRPIGRSYLRRVEQRFGRVPSRLE
jgi:two-component system LytT family response regulator